MPRPSASMLAACALCVLAVLASTPQPTSAADITNARNKGDLVTAIPGFSKPVKHFSGLIPVGGAKSTGSIYYYLATAPNPTAAPLILWMQNAPDCSAQLSFLFEHGPFRVKLLDATGKKMEVTDNPYSWNKIANVIYVDLPAGNGFSSAKVPAWAPDATAGQAVQFMKQFYLRYPELRKVPLFLGAQTVGVPTMLLAAQRLQREIPNSPLRGYIAISGANNECKFDEGARQELIKMSYSQLFNKTDLEEERRSCPQGYCAQTPTTCVRLAGTIEIQGNTLHRVGFTCPGKAFAPEKPLPAAGILSCGRYQPANAFFDRADVRKALHIPALNPAVPTSLFSACRGQETKMMQQRGPMPAKVKALPLHRSLVRSRGIRALFINGVQSLQAPWTGARQAANGVGLERTRSPLSISLRGRKVGAIEAYGKGPGRELSLVVVDNAGTFVAEDQPAVVQHLVKRFIVRRKIET